VSDCGPAAIDRQHRTRDVRGSVTAQEHRRGTDTAKRHEPAAWLPFLEMAAMRATMAGVGNVPGPKALQVTPVLAISTATARVSPTIAVFVVT
jgi:hypothetical protein